MRYSKKILKKITAVSLCAALIGSVSALSPEFLPDNSITANAAQSASNGFIYTENDDGTVTINKYNGTEEELYIPARLGKGMVTAIGENSFCDNTDITSLILPGSLKRIGEYAFAGCSGIKSVIIPSGVEEIDDGAFGYSSEEEVFLTEVCGVKGTEAERFANDNGIAFTEIKENIILPTAVKINKTKLSLFTGDKETLEAYVYPDYATDKSLTWTSSDPSVAAVNDGIVEAVSAGTANITVSTQNGKTAVCRVSVKKPVTYPTELKLDKTVISIGKGESYKLIASVNPSDAAVKTVRWTSSDRSVVTVSGGRIYGKNNGTADITAWTPNGIKAVCRVTVKNEPSSVALTKTTLSLGMGETFSLSAVLPTGSAAAVRTFSTDNAGVLKMTKTNWTGNFTAVGLGTAYVNVKLYNGLEARCKVNVKAAPTQVKTNRGLMSIGLNEKGKLTCSIPADSACAKRTFRTSNSSIIKMTKTDWTGEFTAVGYGTAWVTVRTYNGLESSCKITVKKPATDIELYTRSRVLKPGQTAALKYHMAADEYTDCVSYSSSDNRVCTVDSSGKIKAVNYGTATITVATQNGKTSDCRITVTNDNNLYKNDPSNKLPTYNYFKAVNQHPELPTGCEITSLTAVLNYYGYNVDKCTMSDNYLEKGEAWKTDFHYAFAGDPRSSYAYGCYAPAIVKAANKYLREKNSALSARQLSGYTFEELFNFTSSGTPVIVWATMDMSQGYYSQSWTASNGNRVTWYAGEHCLVLLGGNKDVVYAADPTYGAIKTYNRSLFKKRYQELFSQAVVIQ